MLCLLRWDGSDVTRDSAARLHTGAHTAPCEGLPVSLAWGRNNTTVWQHTKLALHTQMPGHVTGQALTGVERLNLDLDQHVAPIGRWVNTLCKHEAGLWQHWPSACRIGCGA
jgi:hypothetical protein